MKKKIKTIIIATFLLFNSMWVMAQDLTDASKMHLLKPNNKSVGVAIGASPQVFKNTFGNPTGTTSRYDEFAGETIQSLHYNKCVINFIKGDDERDYHLESFDLQDATIGFGQKDVYLIVIGQSVFDTKYPRGHPLFGRVATRSINGANLTKYLKHEGSNINHVYVNEGLHYGGKATDGSLSLIFSGLTLRRMLLEYNVD